MTDANEGRNRLLNGWQLSKMYTFEVAARHESFGGGGAVAQPQRGEPPH